MAEVHVETKITALNDNKNQLNQVAVPRDTEVELRTNQNNSADGDETPGDETPSRCYSCYVCCNACCKPCMTEHNPLPDSPTRFAAIAAATVSYFSQVIPD